MPVLTDAHLINSVLEDALEALNQLTGKTWEIASTIRHQGTSNNGPGKLDHRIVFYTIAINAVGYDGMVLGEGADIGTALQMAISRAVVDTKQ